MLLSIKSRLASKAELSQNRFLLKTASSLCKPGEQTSRHTATTGTSPPCSQPSCMGTAVLIAPGQAMAAPPRPAGSTGVVTSKREIKSWKWQWFVLCGEESLPRMLWAWDLSHSFSFSKAFWGLCLLHFFSLYCFNFSTLSRNKSPLQKRWS